MLTADDGRIITYGTSATAKLSELLDPDVAVEAGLDPGEANIPPFGSKFNEKSDELLRSRPANKPDSEAQQAAQTQAPAEKPEPATPGSSPRERSSDIVMERRRLTREYDARTEVPYSGHQLKGKMSTLEKAVNEVTAGPDVPLDPMLTNNCFTPMGQDFVSYATQNPDRDRRILKAFTGLVTAVMDAIMDQVQQSAKTPKIELFIEHTETGAVCPVKCSRRESEYESSFTLMVTLDRTWANDLKLRYDDVQFPEAIKRSLIMQLTSQFLPRLGAGSYNSLVYNSVNTIEDLRNRVRVLDKHNHDQTVNYEAIIKKLQRETVRLEGVIELACEKLVSLRNGLSARDRHIAYLQACVSEGKAYIKLMIEDKHAAKTANTETGVAKKVPVDADSLPIGRAIKPKFPPKQVKKTKK